MYFADAKVFNLKAALVADCLPVAQGALHGSFHAELLEGIPTSLPGFFSIYVSLDVLNEGAADAGGPHDHLIVIFTFHVEYSLGSPRAFVPAHKYAEGFSAKKDLGP